MNAYERRIIHAEIQKIEASRPDSVGAEGNRRVIIFPEGAAKPTELAKPEKKSRPPQHGTPRQPKTERTERRRTEPKTEKEEGYVPRRRSDTPRPAPRKIEKAKGLDAYFAKLTKNFQAIISSKERSRRIFRKCGGSFFNRTSPRKELFMSDMFTSTIAAVSTPRGKGGIAVIRISGPDALSICEKFIHPKSRKPLSSVPANARRPRPCFGSVRRNAGRGDRYRIPRAAFLYRRGYGGN